MTAKHPAPQRAFHTSTALAFLLLIVACVPRAANNNYSIDLSPSEPTTTQEVRSAWVNESERQATVDALLEQPLALEQALQVALLNNRALQADLAEIDVRTATLRQEAAMANPELHSELYVYGPDSWGLHRVDASLEVSLTDLFSLAARLRAASEGAEAGRAQAAARILAASGDVRRTWVHYVAAQHALQHRQQVHQAARAAAETARIYHEAGNLADDELYEMLAFSAEARQDLFRAEDDVGRWREELALLLGLPVDGDWSVLSQLAKPSDELPSADELQEQALQRSPLLRQLELEEERQRALATTSRWQGALPALRVGVAADWRAPDLEVGPSLGLAIPIFDRRQFERDAIEARRIQLDFQRQEQTHRIAVFSARVHRRLQESHRRAQHFSEEILPIRERLVEEKLRQYNAMTIGVFELLDARRAHLQAEANYVEVLRDYWLARVDYDLLLAGGMTGEASGGADRGH